MILSFMNLKIERLFLSFFIFATFLYLIFFNLLFELGLGLKSLSFNSWYLWKLFRENKINDNYEWVTKTDSQEDLESFTKSIVDDYDEYKTFLLSLSSPKRKPWVKFIDFFRKETVALYTQFHDYLFESTPLTFYTKKDKIYLKRKSLHFKNYYKSLNTNTSIIFKNVFKDSVFYSVESAISFDYSVLFLILITWITIIFY